ncbi:MAG: ABC transporter permease [Spirochaetaceae bacterium]|nr:MAG: ABC transporter permease [Spirochaetaceae bacterium]
MSRNSNAQSGARALFERVHGMKSGNILIVFVAIQIIAIGASLAFPENFRYLSTSNLQVLFRSIPTLGIIAMGVNLLMISGEFDLSVGSTFALASLVMAKLFNAGTPLIVAILLAVALGIAVGGINGYIVVKSNVPSFIITLGSMWFWRGIVLLLSQASNEAFNPGPTMTNVFTASIGPVQVQFLWFVAIAILCWLLLERHRLGNHFFATGGNVNAARALGINVKRIKMTGFMILGGLASLSGIISTTRVNNVSPIQGEGLELQAIAACVIGGTALMGGRGSVLGAFLGAALLFTVQDVLLLLRAPGYYLRLFVGLIIVLAVVLNEILRKK